MNFWKYATKTVLRRALEQSIRHQQMPVRAISPNAEMNLRDKTGFIPACRYWVGDVPMRDEIGQVNGVRYRLKSRKGDK